MNIWQELDDLRRAWDVLDHPAYRRLRVGALSWMELASCVGQYRFALSALAGAAQGVAGAAGDEAAECVAAAAHARQRKLFVRQWGDFARQLGAAHLPPTAETIECTAAWWCDPAGVRGAAQVTLYAVVSALPAITSACVAALAEHYGFVPDTALGHMKASAVQDQRYATATRRLLTARPELLEADPAGLLSQVEAAYSAHWDLLEASLASAESVLDNKIMFLNRPYEYDGSKAWQGRRLVMAASGVPAEKER